MKKKKVYGIGWMGRYRRIVAASSQKEAARLIGTTLSHLREYASVTGNTEEVELAMSDPGSVWERKDHGHDVWRKV